MVVELERNANNILYPRVEASRTATLAGWQTSVRGRAYREEFPFRALRILRDADGRLGWTDYHFEQPGAVWLGRLPGGGCRTRDSCRPRAGTQSTVRSAWTTPSK